MEGFCTKCGAALSTDARFCTSCGAPVGAAARPPAPSSTPVVAIAVGALLVTLGGIAAYFALRTNTEVPRAVSGRAGAPAAPGASGAAAGNADGLPTGHPSIELPKEVIDFLDGLTAEAEKNPQSIEALQRLTHARYRASVINASYRVSAEQALDRLLALDPSNVDGLRIAANLAYDAGNFPEAEKRFGTFLAKNPDDASALTDLGSALLFQDKTDAAITQYRSAIAKKPDFMQAHFNLGVALDKQNKKDEAITALRRALELAGTPDERQHVENALAELEGRAPMAIAGARTRGSAPPMGSATGTGAAGPATSPAGAATGAAGGTAPRLASGAPAPGAATAPAGAPSAPQGSMQGGMPMPPPAPDRDVPTNAATDFQRQAEKPLVTHPIVGPRVIRFDWTTPAAVSVRLADFPMDKMPPFARTKFETGMAAKVAEIAGRHGVKDPVAISLVDNASGNVMGTFDTAKAGAAPQ